MQIPKFTYKLLLLVILTTLLFIGQETPHAQAQWPPFDLRITPTHADGKITYTMIVRREVEWTISDLTVNIPLPEGTRFLEATTTDLTAVNFNGEEISFFTSTFNRPIRGDTFIIEVTDPSITEFEIQPWLAWRGDQPGDYLMSPITVDTTKKPLNWVRPRPRNLVVEPIATIEDDIISYTIYLDNFRLFRLWDVQISVPLPAGTTFHSTQTPGTFVSGEENGEVNFSTIELTKADEETPIIVRAKIDEGETGPFATNVWASWRISDRRAGITVDATEQFLTGDIIVEPTSHISLPDNIGDAAFSNYDVSAASIRNEGDSFGVTLHFAGDLCPVDAGIQISVLIDQDCSSDTGVFRRGLGADYDVLYRLDNGRTLFRQWDAEERRFVNVSSELAAEVEPGGNQFYVSVPYEFIDDDREFCWVVQARNRTQEFSPNPAADWVPDNTNTRFSLFNGLTEVVEAPQVSTNMVATESLTETNFVCGVPVAAPEPDELEGNLAIPLLNDDGLYDTHIFSIADGEEIAVIENASQPDIRPDGRRMLINRQGTTPIAIYEYNIVNEREKKVSGDQADSFATYNAAGDQIAYANDTLLTDEDETTISGLFVQCSVDPPRSESDETCKNIVEQGVLIAADAASQIQGSHPVWTDNDLIAFKGCNTWASGSRCGIFTVPVAATAAGDEGVNPSQITDNATDTPSDTQGTNIAYTSLQEGDWEAYVIGVGRDGLRNLSNSPASNDGLPTISPDGNWVAFVSDRDGNWAVWATLISGGEIRKLFDLPEGTTFNTETDAWLQERMSWGAAF